MNPLDHQIAQTIAAMPHRATLGGSAIRFGPQMLAMRELGHTFRDIGKQFGVSHATVRNVCREILRERK